MIEIVIDGEREIGKVNPLIFGQNLEHLHNMVYGGIFDEDTALSDERGFRVDVIDAMKRTKTGILRWPGGNFASGYHWEDAIGPKDKRPILYDLNFRVEEPNSFGTDEFIEYCRAVGAEPYITVNIGSGAPEDAAHWVEYCNRKGKSHYAKLREECGHSEPHTVKYWSIGNEMYGDWQIGVLPAEEYARKCRETAKLMKRVDPNIKLAAVGIGDHLDGDSSELYWNLEILKTAGDFIDYLSIHRYYFIKREITEENYYGLLACPLHLERKLNGIIKLIDVAKRFLREDKSIDISLDEWNFKTRMLCSALATARFFNVLQRLSRWVTIGCFYPIIDKQWGGWGLISVDKKGSLLEASYYAFDLYANHTGESVLDTRVQSRTYEVELSLMTPQGLRPIMMQGIPYVDSSATLSRDGKTLFIATVNTYKDDKAEAKIRLRDISVKKKGRIFELNGPYVTACNNPKETNKVGIKEKTIENAGERFSYVFPPHSATVIELKVNR